MRTAVAATTVPAMALGPKLFLDAAGDGDGGEGEVRTGAPGEVVVGKEDGR